MLIRAVTPAAGAHAKMDNAVWQEVQAHQLASAALKQMGQMCLAPTTLVLQVVHAVNLSSQLVIRTTLATKRL